MEVLSYQNGLQGLQKATEGLVRNADTVAKAVGDEFSTQDMSTVMVEAKQNQILAEASVEVVKSVDEMNEAIIDMKA